MDFHLKTLTVDGKNVKIMLFDIAGQERYSSMTRAYYKDAHGCLVVGDLQQSSFEEDVQIWKRDIDEKVMFPVSNARLPTVLLCNKIDTAVGESKW